MMMVVAAAQPTTAAQTKRHKSPRGYCTPMARALSPSSICYDHLIGKAHGSTNSGTIANNTNKISTPDETSNNELVYVRLETLGATIQELSTNAINERLARGLFKLLLLVEVAQEQPIEGEDSTAYQEIRAQILARSPGVGGQQLGDKCRLSMQRFLCRMAYPSCHFRRWDASALVRPPCREDCLLLRDLLCPNLDWAKFSIVLARAFNSSLKSSINALDLSAQGEFPQSLTDGARNGSRSSLTPGNYSFPSPSLHFYWPHSHSIQRCERLPLRSAVEHRPGAKRAKPRRTAKGLPLDRWPVCSSAGLSRTASKRAITTDCIGSANGAEYQGTRNQSRSGLYCQPWQSQRPHKHPRSELLFDNMRHAHNYCRNPGGLELGPWCYTQDKGTKWEYCDIAHCE